MTSVLDLQMELETAKREMNNATMDYMSAAEKRAPWLKVLGGLDLILEQVDEVEPSLDVLDRISDAVSIHKS